MAQYLNIYRKIKALTEQQKGQLLKSIGLRDYSKKVKP